MKSDSCFVISAFSALVVFVLFMRFSPDFFAWSGWDMCGDACTVQNWLSALGGWIGAAVAGGAAIPLIRQLEEQRKQTAFMVGDAKPTMTTMRMGSDYPGRLRFKLTNWNRRSLEPERLRAFIDGAEVPITMTEFSAVRFEAPWTGTAMPLGKITQKIIIPGWEDRAQPPCGAIITVHTKDPRRSSASLTQTLRIELKVELFGDKVERHLLYSEGPILA